MSKYELKNLKIRDATWGRVSNAVWRSSNLDCRGLVTNEVYVPVLHQATVNFGKFIWDESYETLWK